MSKLIIPLKEKLSINLLIPIEREVISKLIILKRETMHERYKDSRHKIYYNPNESEVMHKCL